MQGIMQGSLQRRDAGEGRGEGCGMRNAETYNDSGSGNPVSRVPLRVLLMSVSAPVAGAGAIVVAVAVVCACAGIDFVCRVCKSL